MKKGDILVVTKFPNRKKTSLGIDKAEGLYKLATFNNDSTANIFKEYMQMVEQDREILNILKNYLTVKGTRIELKQDINSKLDLYDFVTIKEWLDGI